MPDFSFPVHPMSPFHCDMKYGVKKKWNEFQETAIYDKDMSAFHQTRSGDYTFPRLL